MITGKVVQIKRKVAKYISSAEFEHLTKLSKIYCSHRRTDERVHKFIEFINQLLNNSYKETPKKLVKKTLDKNNQY